MNGPQPPAWLTACLRWFCAEELIEEIEGDLLEAYQHRYQASGKRYANHAYFLDVLTFFRPYAFERYSRAKQFLPMFSNQLKIALRNIWHRKAFTAMNALGLILSLTAVLLIGIYLRHEYSYDEYLPAADRIYRLENALRDQLYSCMPMRDYFRTGPEEQLILVNHLTGYEEVEQSCHFVTTDAAIGAGRPFYAKVDDKRFVLANALCTNTPAAYQEMFPPQYLLGTASTFEQQRNAIVLNETTANKWFGSQWAFRSIVGKTVAVEDSTYVITGVIKDHPSNSHFDFEALVHQRTVPSWGAYTYVQLKPGANPTTVWERLNADADLIYPGYSDNELARGFQARALADIHFSKDVLYELKATARPAYLRIFAWSALLILLVFWTNYSNLSIAMYADRQRELGMRKILGARAQDISWQIVVEALALALVCSPLVLLLTAWLVPHFGQLMGVELLGNQVFTWEVLLGLFVLLVLTALFSSSYPAMRYSQQPLLVSLGQQYQRLLGQRQFNFRRVLLTFQFFLVVGLLSLTAFIYQQMRFINEVDLGFEQEGVVYFSVPDATAYQQLTQRLSGVPGVASMGANSVPGAEMFNQLTYQLKEGETVFSDATELYLDQGSLETLGLNCDACGQLAEGKERIFLINQTAANKLAKERGVEPASLIGEVLVLEPEYENEEYGYGIHYPIDGIIEDYKYFSLKHAHQPLMISVYRELPWVYEMMVKLSGNDWAATLATIKKAAAAVAPDRPFKYRFLEDRIAQLYEAERQSSVLLTILCCLTVFLALLGLSGVVAYWAQRQQKEMGIRKVLGASTAQLIFRFNREYMILLAIATIAVFPLAIWLARYWLADFAFRIDPQAVVVFGAGLAALLFVSMVVSFFSHQAAAQSPATVLRKDG